MDSTHIRQTMLLGEKIEASLNLPKIRDTRKLMAVFMGLADFLGLFFSGLLAVYIRIWIKPDESLLMLYPRLIPIIFIFMVVYKLQNLYHGSQIGQVEELRRLTISTSLTFLILAAYLFWTQTGLTYSRFVYIFTWLLALVLVPVFRAWIRRLAIHVQLWGEPVAIIGSGKETDEILALLSAQPEIGYIPDIVIRTPEPGQAGAVQTWLEDTYQKVAQTLAKANIETAIMFVSEVPTDIRTRLIKEKKSGLRHIILVPDVGFLASTPILAYDFHGAIGIEVQRNLLSKVQKMYKRATDLALIIFFSPLLLVIVGAIGLAIKIESPGPIFFLHKRIGVDGKPFMVWKFRTMVDNADQVFQEILARSPEMRKEWQTYQKLKQDPRVTRVGKFLRHFSLDELPQLWNVLRGEMSLVGPRPIMLSQREMYGDRFDYYQLVRPGLTGLWQVNGRNSTTFQRRAELDEQYILSWSIWLDLVILFQTIWAVLRPDGY